MSNMQSAASISFPPALVDKWQRHEFYASAVVLGLDVGVDSIGVCVRCGTEIIYAKTWQYPLPELAPLKARRQKRSWRRCRANRKTRLARLKQLFDAHGLRWLEIRPILESDPPEVQEAKRREANAVRNTDPFFLRHRAVTGRLASVEALSLAIRHCVTHRGYDYHYGDDENALSWEDDIDFEVVLEALQRTWLTGESASEWRNSVANFEHWSNEQRQEFERVLHERTRSSEIVEERLAVHYRGSYNHVRNRARGETFPRAWVWEHLEKIVRRHADMVNDVEGFLATLSLKPDNPRNRDRAIFFYHRKTSAEMRLHRERQHPACPYAGWLGIGQIPVGDCASVAIRRFRLLELATTHELELLIGGGRRAPAIVTRVFIGEELTCYLLDCLATHSEGSSITDIAAVRTTIATQLVRQYGGKLAPQSGKFKSHLNTDFFATLNTLLTPPRSSRKQNASMSVEAAERLFAIATAGGLSRETVNDALANCPVPTNVSPPSYWEFRRMSRFDNQTAYPQIEFLFGQRVKQLRTRNGKFQGQLAYVGKLQRLFAELSSQLSGKTAPDYCVFKVARYLPRNQAQRRQREMRVAATQRRHETLLLKYGLSKDAEASKKRRVELYEEQQRLCPFTGLPLGADPFSELLAVTHLYPACLGGLTVHDNLVLTFANIARGEKKKLTPQQYASSLSVSFERMQTHVAQMRWSRFKRGIFEWNEPDQIPPLRAADREPQFTNQLLRELSEWMGISANGYELEPSREQTRCIGQATIFLTTACRRAWALPQQKRTDLLHPLVEAIILSHIPPESGHHPLGQDSIFIPIASHETEHTTLGVLPAGPSPVIVTALVAPDSAACPVDHPRITSTRTSVHHHTIFRVQPDGSLVYRVELPDKAALDASLLRKLLEDSGVPRVYHGSDGIDRDLIPDHDALECWLQSEGDEPLRLRNGTPVRAIWRRSGQGHLKETPIGFYIERNAQGGFAAVKAIHANRWSALELWRGWDRKRQCWAYFKQLLPSPSVLQALRSVGISWSKKSKQCWRENSPVLKVPLRNVVNSKLPPYACRAVRPETGTPVVFRLGDTFLCPLAANGNLAKRGELVASREWLRVTAVMAQEGGRLRLKKVLSGNDGWQALPLGVDDLAYLAGLPPASDSSAYPRQHPPKQQRT